MTRIRAWFKRTEMCKLIAWLLSPAEPMWHEHHDR